VAKNLVVNADDFGASTLEGILPMQPYTEEFYQDQRDGSRRSAEEIVPLVLELVQPRRVIDVGCGLGTWLAVFRQLGVEDVWGIDGEYVDRSMLEIPAERFLARDLSQPWRQEDRPFDLVLSLEVAEHLPADCARAFVQSLARLGPVVLFSAAIPYQGGTNHVNEQWPDYWAERFREVGYIVIDCIREQVWQNPRVEWWYAQNVLLFVREDHLPAHPELAREAQRTRPLQLSLVHPRKYLDGVLWGERLRSAAQELAALVPAGNAFILVDEGQWDVAEYIAGRRCIPFLERDGEYWGAPDDDETAIGELERLRRAGAGFLAFGWPAFWWLDYYAGFQRHLRQQFPCVLENDRLIVFDLRS
jgi:SAM-dependent methyltransferase